MPRIVDEETEADESEATYPGRQVAGVGTGMLHLRQLLRRRLCRAPGACLACSRARRLAGSLHHSVFATLHGILLCGSVWVHVVGQGVLRHSRLEARACGLGRPGLETRWGHRVGVPVVERLFLLRGREQALGFFPPTPRNIKTLNSPAFTLSAESLAGWPSEASLTDLAFF